MTSRFYRRRWDESRGDEFDAWGPADYFFEVQGKGFPMRQMEVYDAGHVLRYGPDHQEDRHGFLSYVKLDDGLEDWSVYAISREEFEQAGNSGPGRSTQGS